MAENWDDEEWRKQQNITYLREKYYAFERAGDTAKADAIKGTMKSLLQGTSAENLKNVDPFCILSVVDVIGETDLSTLANPDGSSRDFITDLSNAIHHQLHALGNNTDLISYLERKALLEAVKKINPASQATYQSAIDVDKPELENSITSASGANTQINDDTVTSFIDANNSGALDDVDPNVKDNMLAKIRTIAGFENATDNDEALREAVASELTPYDEDGDLTELYSECQDIIDTLKYDFPAGTDQARQDELTQAYNRQLLANAAQRAAQSLLQQKYFSQLNQSPEAIEQAYKDEIGRQFERSVILARLSSDPRMQNWMAAVKIDSNGNVSLNTGNNQDANDALAAAMETDPDKVSSVHPLAVSRDTYELEQESKQVAKQLKAKRFQEKGESFLNKVKKGSKEAWLDITKKKGWIGIATSGAVFMTAGALAPVFPTTAIIVYGTGTLVNAWVMPVVDQLRREAYQNSPTGKVSFKTLAAYVCKKFISTWRSKINERSFVRHGLISTGVGGIVAACSCGFLNWINRTLERQATMISAQGVQAAISWGLDLHSKKKYNKDKHISKFKTVLEDKAILHRDIAGMIGVASSSVLMDVGMAAFGVGPLAGIGEDATVESINTDLADGGMITTDAEGKPILVKPDGTTSKLDSINDNLYLNPETHEILNNAGKVISKTAEDATVESINTDLADGGMITTDAEGNTVRVGSDGSVASVSKINNNLYLNPETHEILDNAGKVLGKTAEDATVESINTDLADGGMITTDAEGKPILVKPDGTTSKLDSINDNLYLNPETHEVLDNAGKVIGKTAEDATVDSVKTDLEDGSMKLTTADNQTVDINAEGERVFDTSSISGDESKMYLNSVKKWGNNALAHRIEELRSEGQAVDQSVRDAFADNAAGKEIVQEFYNNIAAGKVEFCPEGVSPVEYVDKMTRLMQLAPVEHKAAIAVMIKDLKCESFVPSDAEKELVNKALSDIIYEKGSYQYAVLDTNGNLCIKSTSRFGQYVGPQQQVEVDGQLYPLRNHNVTNGLEITDGCGGKYKLAYTRVEVDCGCGPAQEESVATPEVDASVASNNDITGISTVEIPAEPTTINVNFTDPYAEATATNAGNGSDYQVGQSIPEGAEFIKMDNDGKLHLWQKGATVEGSNVTSQPSGVETIHTVALDIDMNNLGKAQISDTPESLKFNFGSGKNILTFILDKQNGEMHTFVGNKEVILDQATTQEASRAINIAMTDGGLDQRYSLSFGVESEQNNDHLASVAERIRRIKANKEATLNRDIADAVGRAGGRKDTTVLSNGVTYPQGTTQEVSASISPAQQEALMSENANIAYVKPNGGALEFSVQGVEGVERIQLPKMTNVSFAEGAEASVTTEGEGDAITRNVTMTTKDGKQLTVVLGQDTKVLLDGQETVLSPDSAESVEQMTRQALEGENIVVKNLSLSPFAKGSLGDKLYGIYKTATAAAARGHANGGRN